MPVLIINYTQAGLISPPDGKEQCSAIIVLQQHVCLVTGVCLGQWSIDTEAFSVIDMWYISYCLGLFVCSAGIQGERRGKDWFSPQPLPLSAQVTDNLSTQFFGAGVKCIKAKVSGALCRIGSFISANTSPLHCCYLVHETDVLFNK